MLKDLRECFASNDRSIEGLASFAVLTLLFVAPALAGALTYLPASVAVWNLCVMGSLALLFAMIPPGQALLGRLLVVAIASIASLLLVCDAISYKVTGGAINYYFWKVVSWPAIKSSFQVFTGLASLAVTVLLLPLIGGLLFLNRPLLSKSTSITAWVVAPLGFVAIAMALVLDSSPAHVIRSYVRQSNIERALADVAEFPPVFTSRDDIRALPGKNIIWVFLESFNDALVDDTQFPGLTPNLARLSREGLRLGSLIQIPGQQGSFTGMEAAQCGRYTFHTVPDAYDVCMGHILHAAGYRQVFIGGYDLEFLGLPDRLQSWRFDEIIGKPQFDQMPKYARSKGGWGYFDSVLFDYAYLKFLELQRDGKPFYMVLFTQDMHDGHFDETRCGGLEQPYVGPGKDNKIIQSVRCADVLLGDFIRRISQHSKFADTIIVLVGDHIMHERLIHIRKNHDTIFGLVLNGGIRRVHEGTSTHMDVAPTVLALADIRTNAVFLDGKDLLGSSKPARNIDLSSLPKEVLDEFGLVFAPDQAQRGIIYKHTWKDAYEYIRANDVPFQERDGIRAYSIETTSYLWRNILVLLDAKDCASLEGKPYAMYLDQKGESTKFDFTTAAAKARELDGRCGRLLSFYVSYKSNTKALRVGIEKSDQIKWEASLKP